MESELEKMLAGKDYNANDPQLVAARDNARKVCREFNNEFEAAKRSAILKTFLGGTGEKVHMEANLRVDYGSNIYLGENFYSNFDCTMLDVCKISIGENAMLAPGVHIYTATHPLDAKHRTSGVEFGKPVTIGKNVWIGGCAVINPGVTLGDNVVVGSGSVVTKSFPDNVVIAGNPAKIIRVIQQSA